MRTYSELITLDTFEERFEYLRMNGKVGDLTFGHDRYMNQWFYKTDEWLRVRDIVIQRDYGNDLGVEGCEIGGIIIVHHMNAITREDIINRNPKILEPEYLICVSDRTHKAIHYNNDQFLTQKVTVRMPNDMAPWKTQED